MEESAAMNAMRPHNAASNSESDRAGGRVRQGPPLGSLIITCSCTWFICKCVQTSLKTLEFRKSSSVVLCCHDLRFETGLDFANCNSGFLVLKTTHMLSDARHQKNLALIQRIETLSVLFDSKQSGVQLTKFYSSFFSLDESLCR